MALQLRDYQEEAVQRTLRAFKGINSPLLVLATGAGKTVIFSEIIRRFNRRTLVIAHRDELLTQAKAKLLEINPQADVGLFNATEREVKSKVIVASVPTLARGNRLKELPKDIDLIVCDEAHHAAANSYQKIFNHFGCNTYGGAKLLGVTATPSRTDKKEIGNIFEAIIFEKNVLELIKEGYLVDIRGIRVNTKVDISSVKTVRGDFDEKQLAKIINTPARNKLVVETFLKHARNRAPVVFAVNVQHCYDLKKEFEKHSIKTEVVTGSMKQADRKRILQDFRDGKIQVLVNVNVLTEGTDLPRIDAVLMVRPTMSSALYQQAIGRGLRLYPGKSDCLVIDFVDNCSRHELVSTAQLLKELPSEPREKQEREPGESDESGVSKEDLMRQLEDATWEYGTGILGLVPARSGFTWVPLMGGIRGFALDYGNKSAVVMIPFDDAGEHWLAYNIENGERALPISDAASIEFVQNTAEEWIRKHPDLVSGALIHKNVKWRNEPVSEVQAEKVKKAGYVVPATKGEASDIIARITISKMARRLLKTAE